MDMNMLYPMHFDALANYAARMSGAKASGEDIAQEVFMRAMANEEVFARLSDGQQKAWLYTTAKRIFIDQKRRADRAPIMDDAVAWSDDLTAMDVDLALASLSAQSAHIVRLKHFAGMNSGEIGALLNLPPATVRTKLRAAMAKLRKTILEQEDIK